MRADIPTWLDLMATSATPVGGDQLREWGVSETWRIHWDDGASTIAKRAADEGTAELDVYERLLIPHRIAAPRLLGSYRGDDFVVLMLDDLGLDTLQARPSADGWTAAARLLARTRHEASGRLGAAGEFRYATDEITETWVRATVALAAVRPDLAGALDPIGPLLGPHLHRLGATVPDTIVHGDFESKNLVLGAAGPAAIDWDTAQIGAHLGDLYSLLRDTGIAGADVSAIVPAYARECAALGYPAEDLDWQIAVAGVVWTLRALRWVLEKGVHLVPEMLTWIDELVERAGTTGGRLATFG